MLKTRRIGLVVEVALREAAAIPVVAHLLLIKDAVGARLEVVVGQAASRAEVLPLRFVQPQHDSDAFDLARDSHRNGRARCDGDNVDAAAVVCQANLCKALCNATPGQDLARK
jgi:hypothetical protein